MSGGAHLWPYFIVVLGIVALPGLDMAYVIGSAILGGRRAGLAAVGGIMAGGLCHVLMAGLGVAALLQLWPPLFDAMLAAGALYLGWMGWTMLGSSGAHGAAPGQASPGACPAGTTFRRAMLTNLLNPKAYVFMLAIFPQFIKPELGPLWLQAAALGAITALTQAGVYGALALLAARGRNGLLRHPVASRRAAHAMGWLLIGLALWSLLHMVLA